MLKSEKVNVSMKDKDGEWGIFKIYVYFILSVYTKVFKIV